jgi:hypothetical protein
MPRYYFSLENGQLIAAEDPEDLADDAAARVVAEEVARDLARNNKSPGSDRVIARNANNKLVWEVLLKDVARF